jgi:hypothetical protein
VRHFNVKASLGKLFRDQGARFAVILNEKYFAPVWHIAPQRSNPSHAPQKMTTSGVMLRCKAEKIRLRKLSLIAMAALTRCSTPAQFCITRSHSRHVFAMARG